MIVLYLFLMCTSLAMSNGVPAEQNESGCGVWTEWTGDCHYERCGICNTQERVRDNGSECPGHSKELRNCQNHICYYPCYTCAKGCSSSVHGGRYHCRANNETINDVVPIYPPKDQWNKGANNCALFKETYVFGK